MKKSLIAALCTILAVVAVVTVLIIKKVEKKADDNKSVQTSESFVSVSDEKTSLKDDKTSSGKSEETSASSDVSSSNASSSESSDKSKADVSEKESSEKPVSDKSNGKDSEKNTEKSTEIILSGPVTKPTYIKGVLIANKTYALPKDYNPGVDPTAQKAVNEMIAAARKEGHELWVRSGFRSYSYQSELYNNYVARDGKAQADTYSARPGHSEHQTGLSFDLNSLSTSFANTPEGKWLAAHCYEYGFIIRYPKGKESITGYQYEPWHVRYLGKDTAKAVYDSGLTLEEYLGITSKYSD